jgi:hypothetical protein
LQGGIDLPSVSGWILLRDEQMSDLFNNDWMCELHGKKPVRDLREWFLFKN